jgi:hypothetical protein
MTEKISDEPVMDSKEEFVRKLDGSFKKYESILRLHRDITQLQEVVEGLQASGLQYETILILMQHHTKLPKKTIIQVLDGLKEIPNRYFNGD